MRPCDRVIVRKWVQNKSRHHVQESRTFSKGLTWYKLMIIPIKKALAKSRDHFVFGHSPQTLTSGVVRMLYPWNMEHIRNKLRCDNNARTSNVSMKERYWRINSMHVRVKLLDQHLRMWLGRHTVTHNPNCKWHRVSQCRRSPPKWLDVPNEHLVEKSFSRSPFGHPHHETK